MLAICWDHWRPDTWPRVFPFELFLFFFLVMTGALITGSLLRERDRGEISAVPWRARALKIYQLRRGLRILAPYYAALLVAAAVLAPDVLAAPFSYLLHVSNIRIAYLGEWPQGTNHFWSLAMQQQFYLLWPFVIWWLPRRFLVPALLLFSAIGPATRYFHDEIARWLGCPWPQMLTWAAFDYFGIGALFALARHRGVAPDAPVFRWLTSCGWLGFIAIFGAHELGRETFGFRPLQQTFLAIGLCGLLARAIRGFPPAIGKFLETPWLQAVGEKSYGLYLYHNIAPLVAGKLFFFLWFGPFAGEWAAPLRIGSFALVTWLLTAASWRFIEAPLNTIRAKVRTGNQ